MGGARGAGGSPGRKREVVRLARSQLESRPPATADEERDVGLLDRLGVGVVVGDRVVLAAEREGGRPETPLEPGNRLSQPGLADPARDERQTECRLALLVP